MKKMCICRISIDALAFLLVFGSFISCNQLSGDNKTAEIDSAPKPQLTAMTLRTDVPTSFTNEFSGIINFIEKNIFDTTSYNMYISKHFVRLDKIRNNNNFESVIINLLNQEMLVLSHAKKLYSKFNVNKEQTEYDDQIKIIKTNNEKTILNKTCKQWRVKNVKENTEVTYWVDSSNYGFYYYFIKIWNPTSKPNKYFQLIPFSFNCMPLEIVERNLLRDIKSNIAITKIERTSLDSNLFVIPKNYTLFSN